MDNSVKNTVSDIQFTEKYFEFSEDNNDTADAKARLSAACEGDTVVLGGFKQCAEWNCKKTPVEWIVLNRSGNRLLLLSKYVLIAKGYNDQCCDSGEIKDINDPNYDPEAVSWKKSSIRKWLYSEFMSAKNFDPVFSAGEKRIIEMVRLQNYGNPVYKTAGCAPTEDYVFLLSSEEVKKYIPEKADRAAFATAYARKSGANCNNDQYCSWWTRSPGANAHGTVIVDAYGNVNSSYSNNFGFVGVRPALWVNVGL